MDNKTKIALILIIYAVLAIIPGILGYVQYMSGPQDNDECDSCHNNRANMSFVNETDAGYDTGSISMKYGNKDIP